MKKMSNEVFVLDAETEKGKKENFDGGWKSIPGSFPDPDSPDDAMAETISRYFFFGIFEAKTSDIRY